MTPISRNRLRLGFDDDFGVIELRLVRIEPVEMQHSEDEEIQWINVESEVPRSYFAESPIRRFRVKSSVLLSVVALIVATVTLVK